MNTAANANQTSPRSKLLYVRLEVNIPRSYAKNDRASALVVKLEKATGVRTAVVLSDVQDDLWLRFTANANDPMSDPSFAAHYILGLVK